MYVNINTMDNARLINRKTTGYVNKNQKDSGVGSFVKILDAVLLGAVSTTVFTDGLNLYIGAVVGAMGGFLMGRSAYREIQKEKLNK
jgi:hypothetical protein